MATQKVKVRIEADGAAGGQWFDVGLGEREASKAKLRQIEEAEVEAAGVVSRQDDAKPGRPKAGNREAARKTGLSEADVRRTKRHIQTAEAFPALQGAEWMREWALAFPADDRSGAAPEFRLGRCAIFEEPTVGWLGFGVDIPDNVGVCSLLGLGGYGELTQHHLVTKRHFSGRLFQHEAAGDHLLFTHRVRPPSLRGERGRQAFGMGVWRFHREQATARECMENGGPGVDVGLMGGVILVESPWGMSPYFHLQDK